MQALIDMFKKIIASNAPVHHLELRNFSDREDEGLQVIDTLIDSMRRSFEGISLSGNPGWSHA